ncbi:MAG: Eco57I restriction-modification methylase domain-containing protein [Azonexus sp.]|nr:Eco57I restriction-modification methylase domain-containing protein [Azonexus sp.]MBP6905460.1 Eco57I restriction-modification methylase domain-containing protein [Azonexus sp.]
MPAETPQARYEALKTWARRFAEARGAGVTGLSIARAFCTAVLARYWNIVRRDQSCDWEVRPHGLSLPGLPTEARDVACAIGELIAESPLENAGYLVGSIYTAMIPARMRGDMGAYYTPPALAQRLLDLATAAGADFARCRALDPACGGGAFLAPVALRMLSVSPPRPAASTVQDIATRLRGVELDPFAAWITQVLLEAALLPLCIAARTRFPAVVTVGDALAWEGPQKFDLVVGNPPYGRVRLDEATRNRYARSLYGHANLYGLFTDLALRRVTPGGVVAYLTPTSFLGGQYFKALRKILAEHATPLAFDFVTDREGVFDDVLQEVVLVAYQAARLEHRAKVSLTTPAGQDGSSSEALGRCAIPRDGSPWIIPRQRRDTDFLEHVAHMPSRLNDWGYGVSTGPLVWNRHKPQLRLRRSGTELPVIWAESVTGAGFRFSADRRNHAPFISLADQPHLVAKHSCVLLQRTTAKEQDRRLIGAVLPQEFLDAYGGAVIENHLNMIIASEVPKVSPGTVAKILNSRPADRVFRCINGSVAVSAYELEALPLPTVDQALQVERMLERNAAPADIEAMIAQFYGGSVP